MTAAFLIQELLPIYNESIDDVARRAGRVARAASENVRMACAHVFRLSALELPPDHLTTAKGTQLAPHYAAFLHATLHHLSGDSKPGMFWELQELAYCAACVAQVTVRAQRGGASPLPGALRGRLWGAARGWACLGADYGDSAEATAALTREGARYVERIRDPDKSASTQRDVSLCTDCVKLQALQVCAQVVVG